MSNEITAYFKGTSGVAESVYQYDYGMILVIDGLDLTSAFEVHFEHTGAVPAVTEIGEDNMVAIPNECLALPGKVTAYIYEHTGSHDGETAYVVRFHVMHRARPEYVETTPAQDSVISKAIAALSNFENKVNARVDNKLRYKVNIPLDEFNQISNGKAGQLLRTKGNGATEWVDEGLPTDEQTASAVFAWLDEHPEATTTVQDNSLTYKKMVLGTLGYVIPQMFGAAGDGITDDTEAIQAAVDTGFNVYFPKGSYLCSTITINNSHKIIDGGGSDINFGESTGFVIPITVHDIEIRNFNSVCEFEKGSSKTTNAHISVYGQGNAEYYAYNIIIRNCNFVGGVMGVSASSAKNVTIIGCTFDGFVYKPEDYAGGYGILLQSCIDVAIYGCRFSLGKYGRHDIYISVDRRKTENKRCKNIVIDACSFDHSDLELDGNLHYYSGTTTPINVRTSTAVSICNCYYYSTVGMVTFYAEDGDIDGAFVSKCVIDSPVFNNGSNELKYVINFPATNYYVCAVIDGVKVFNEPNDYQSFAYLNKCNVKVINCDIGATRILCGNGVTIQIDNVSTKITYYFIRFNGTEQTKGYCRNVTYLVALIGEKYFYNTGASVSDGFFVHDYSEKAYINNTYCYRHTELARYGDLVQCNIGILKDLPKRTLVTLFTLDKEYWPRKEVVFTLITRDNLKDIVQGWIKTNGEVLVYNLSDTISGNLNVNETVSYIGAN